MFFGNGFFRTKSPVSLEFRIARRMVCQSRSQGHLCHSKALFNAFSSFWRQNSSCFMINFHLWQVDFEKYTHNTWRNEQINQKWCIFCHFAAKKTVFYVCNRAIFTHKNVTPELDKAKNGRIEVTWCIFWPCLAQRQHFLALKNTFYVCNIVIFKRKFLDFALRAGTNPGTYPKTLFP